MHLTVKVKLYSKSREKCEIYINLLTTEISNHQYTGFDIRKLKISWLSKKTLKRLSWYPEKTSKIFSGSLESTFVKVKHDIHQLFPIKYQIKLILDERYLALIQT